MLPETSLQPGTSTSAGCPMRGALALPQANPRTHFMRYSQKAVLRDKLQRGPCRNDASTKVY
jgi:hypothetical protein